MNQKFTSASTSINKTKLPAIYGKKNINWATDVLDYGCGRYTEHLSQAVAERGGIWHGYDAYNYRDEHSLSHTYETIVCSNVLNVIAEIDVIRRIINDIMEHLSPNGKAYFTIYEGNRSGIGKQTGTDSYQRNEKLRDYLPFFCGYSAEVKNGMIVVEN